MARTIHVHAAEVSTAPEAVTGYARGIVVALAVAAIALSAWVAMMPSETAELEQVAPNTVTSQAEPLLPPQPEWLRSAEPGATTIESPILAPAPPVVIG